MGATGGTRCSGKGAKSGARCARSPLDCRIRYPAAAAVSHPRPRQRQPRRGVGSQTSRGAEPPLSSDEPGGAASASRKDLCAFVDFMACQMETAPSHTEILLLQKTKESYNPKYCRCRREYLLG
ncbi:unnamed protein product [Coccothraustes coccothraustes]